MQDLSQFIDGKRVKGTSGRFADVLDPAAASRRRLLDPDVE